MMNKPNIVLVHGAWADGSHWRQVIAKLQAKGYPVIAVQNPLTSLEDDIRRTVQVAGDLKGPTLLVGHSYGGMVITGAGNVENVIGLVYIAAFAPDEGEDPAGLFALREAPSGAAAIHPDGHGFLWLDNAMYHEAFCQDVDKQESAILAATQKPIAARCFTDKSGPAAWKNKPSWYQISAQDRMIPPETQRWFAERMQPKKTLVLDASHASLASHADDIVALIDEAANY
ncbi:alpha/beta hydrolase [Serratia sp. AKBS12]|uniref:alpha/beta hydrolase n=1 Tax=Serratia sp. AKBS12 TaxID=2974597 RepID=UPI002165BB64|nr:alpha/beta hydrolase [Serratia sp. AKBS12]MCS3408304.1 alpha/beta hydrolase [Serratia sp. AKBS12]